MNIRMECTKVKLVKLWTKLKKVNHAFRKAAPHIEKAEKSINYSIRIISPIVKNAKKSINHAIRKISPRFEKAEKEINRAFNQVNHSLDSIFGVNHS
jgi:hypothetical protein